MLEEFVRGGGGGVLYAYVSAVTAIEESGLGYGTGGIRPIKTAEPRRQEMTVINSAL